MCLLMTVTAWAAQLSFDHVRIPRESMLMRFAKVRDPNVMPGIAACDCQSLQDCSSSCKELQLYCASPKP